MRFTTYCKYHPELADAVNLQGLLDQLERLPAAERLCRRLALVLARRHARWRALDGRAQAGHPPGPDGLGPAHARHAQGAPRRVHRRRRAGQGDRARAGRAARQDRPAPDRRGLPQRHPAAPGAPGLPVDVRPRRPGALGGAAGPVQPDREGHRLPRLQDAQEPARQRRQVELRRARHALPRHRGRGGGREQAVRVRRRAQPRRPGHAHQRASPARGSACRSTSSTAT